MGWINGDLDPRGRHEGYLVGLVPMRRPDDWRYRELSFDDDQQERIPLRHVQVGCDCGWRSPRLDAPLGAYWWPSYVEVSEWFEDECRQRWREHVAFEAAWKPNPRVGSSSNVC